MHAFSCYYADGFTQIFDLYTSDHGVVIPVTVGTLYHYNDFDIEETGLQDFYFSAPNLIHYL